MTYIDARVDYSEFEHEMEETTVSRLRRKQWVMRLYVTKRVVYSGGASTIFSICMYPPILFLRGEVGIHVK